jgi:hypothetical protein
LGQEKVWPLTLKRLQIGQQLAQMILYSTARRLRVMRLQCGEDRAVFF